MKKLVNFVAMLLVVVGAINWGLIGIFDFNVVTFLFSASMITKVIYVLIGVSGLWAMGMLCKCSKSC